MGAVGSGALMPDDPEETIRRRAYELWEKAGHMGRAEDHWLRAEEELKSRWQFPNGFREGSLRDFTGAPAGELGDVVRPSYDGLPGEPPSEEHWDRLVRLALGRTLGLIASHLNGSADDGQRLSNEADGASSTRSPAN